MVQLVNASLITSNGVQLVLTHLRGVDYYCSSAEQAQKHKMFVNCADSAPLAKLTIVSPKGVKVDV